MADTTISWALHGKPQRSIFSWEELDNNKLLQQLSQGYKNNLNSHLYVN
jgi:hypothetical protein